MKFFALLLVPLLFFSSTQADKAAVIQLTPDNTVTYRGEVDAESVATIEMKLAALSFKRADAKYPIYLVMDCPGGGIYEGENFIQFARTIPNLHTITIFAASMCSAIVEAIPGTRYVTENGVLMFHRAKGSVEGQFEDGELESELTFWKAFVRHMEQRNADRIGISLKTYKQRVKDEYWVLGADNVQQGTADSMATISCSKELLNSTETIKQTDLFGTTEVQQSACPLLR